MNCDNYTIHHDPTPCTEEQFTCSDKLCIALDLACDGISHCDDGTDETIGCEILTVCAFSFDPLNTYFSSLNLFSTKFQLEMRRIPL